MQCGPGVPDQWTPAGWPGPDGDVRPDRLEGGGWSDLAVQRAALACGGLQNQVDPHTAPDGQFEFMHHVTDAECGKADDEQRLRAVVDQLADDRARQPYRLGVTGRPADDHVTAAR